MSATILWTRSSREHIGRHGVTPEAVMQAMEGIVDAQARGARLRVIGKTEDAVLFIVLQRVPGRPHVYRAVTARRATAIEKRLFARRGRRRT